MRLPGETRTLRSPRPQFNPPEPKKVDPLVEPDYTPKKWGPQSRETRFAEKMEKRKSKYYFLQ